MPLPSGPPRRGRSDGAGCGPYMTDTEISRRTFLRDSTGAFAGVGMLGHVPVLLPQRKPRTLREKVAQLFVISFRGTSAGPEILSLLERYAFGGVILYGRNCGTAQQVRALTARLQAASRFPLLICVDQEGGSVVRITNGAPSFPPEAAYGRVGSTQRVTADAATTAQDLRALGLTMNLAP